MHFFRLIWYSPKESSHHFGCNLSIKMYEVIWSRRKKISFTQCINDLFYKKTLANFYFLFYPYNEWFTFVNLSYVKDNKLQSAKLKIYFTNIYDENLIKEKNKHTEIRVMQINRNTIVCWLRFIKTKGNNLSIPYIYIIWNHTVMVR